jgi:hypothetical protein
MFVRNRHRKIDALQNHGRRISSPVPPVSAALGVEDQTVQTRPARLGIRMSQGGE